MFGLKLSRTKDTVHKGHPHKSTAVTQSFTKTNIVVTMHNIHLVQVVTAVTECFMKIQITVTMHTVYTWFRFGSKLSRI